MKNQPKTYDLEVKAKMQDSGSLLATATVILDGVIETHGWRVMTSNKTHPRFQEFIWIQPPSILVNGKNRHALFINNEQTFQAFEDAIYDAFNLKRHQSKDSNSGYTSEQIANDFINSTSTK